MRIAGPLLLLGAAACTERSEVRARLEEGVVYPSAVTCPLGKPCTLTVKTSPSISLGVGDCAAPALAEERSGKAVAYRCADNAPWTVLRLRGGDRYMIDCNEPIGRDAKPDWSKLQPFASSAMKLLDCNRGAAKPWALLTRAIAEESGPEAATAFVVASTLHPSEALGRPALGYPDGWVDAFDTLAAAGQEKVRKETCPALAHASAPSLLYVRAVRRCPIPSSAGPIDDAAVTAALAAFKAALAAPRSDFVGAEGRLDPNAAPTELDPAELASMLEAVVAVRARPKEAAEIACTQIATLSRRDDAFRVSLAATVLATTKTRCAAALAPALWPCGLVAPAKSKIDAQIDRFAKGPLPPVLTSANESLFAAMTVDGNYPEAWLDHQADAGSPGGFCP